MSTVRKGDNALYVPFGAALLNHKPLSAGEYDTVLSASCDSKQSKPGFGNCLDGPERWHILGKKACYARQSEVIRDIPDQRAGPHGGEYEDRVMNILKDILQNEVFPAIGCTEPAACAYASAVAAERLGQPVEQL